MRNAFVEELLNLAKKDPRIVALSGDIGNRLFDAFKKEFPERFYNCGISEATMTGLAAGLAMCGLRPVTYTIASFNIFRCIEQIKLDLCYHNLPVVVVGTGAGLSYASLGATHHTGEDIAMMRALPNMTVVCPADTVELKALLKEAINANGPVYFRIGKKGEPLCHENPLELPIGKGAVVKKGKDLCLITTGNALSIALEVEKRLHAENLFPQVVSFPTVKPLDTDLLESLSTNFSLLVAIEEHSLIGGFSSSVAEFLIDTRKKKPLLRFGLQDRFPSKLGSQTYLRAWHGLNGEKIYLSILENLKRSLCEPKLPS